MALSMKFKQPDTTNKLQYNDLLILLADLL